MPDHVTYRIPKSSVALVEKLFAAYQVPHEELTSEQIFQEALNMPLSEIGEFNVVDPIEKPVADIVNLLGSVFTKKPSVIWPDSFAVADSPGLSIDETSGANQILQDRFHK